VLEEILVIVLEEILAEMLVDMLKMPLEKLL
jgi:hypothetical protein